MKHVSASELKRRVHRALTMATTATDTVRPASARVYPTVSRLSAPRRPKSARLYTDSSTARTETSSDDGESCRWEEDEAWVLALDAAKNAKHGMRLLYEADREMFYLHGDVIYKMLQWRFVEDFEMEA